MRQTHLPEELEEKTIEYLLEGETVYIVPWMLVSDHDRRLYVLKHATYTRGEFGTSHAQISRVNGVIEVNKASLKDYKFRVGSVGTHMGSTADDYMPAVLAG